MSTPNRPAHSPRMTRNAAIYARISETAADRDKVADQVAQCRRLAERRGYLVAPEHIFEDDGISALGGTRRPGWDALLDAVVGGRVGVVLATEEERFARNVAEKADLQAACMEAGAVWETERDGFVDPASESGEFFSTMRAAMGRMESRRKASRQKARNAEASAEGKPVPGRRRYGYETDGRTPRETEAVVVRRLFEHIAAGGSIRAAARSLTAESVDPAPGKSWTQRRLRDMLTNPHYGGVVRHLGKETASGVIVPIVSPELAAEARAIVTDPSRRTGGGPKPQHLSSGIAVCGTCGAPVWHLGRGYRCRVEASHPAIRADFLDDRIRSEVARAFLTSGPGLFPPRSRGVDVASRVAAHARNVAEVRAITDDRAEGLVPADVARARLLVLRDARERIEAELEQARGERGAAGALAQLAASLVVGESWSMRDWATKVAEVAARFDALDLDARRELVRALLYVQVDPGRDPARVRVQHLRALHLNPAELAPER